VSAVSRKKYWLVFAALVVLTVAEVGIVYVPGIARPSLLAALVLMALSKAGLVLMTFMHLGAETRPLKLTVLIPFTVPALLAFALIAEASWRLLP
jgi:caa(3)-type oxidase subunit IV